MSIPLKALVIPEGVVVSSTQEFCEVVALAMFSLSTPVTTSVVASKGPRS